MGYFLSGDPCQVDEAALTGESLPVKVPRKDESGKPYTGRRFWSGSILKVGETEAVSFFFTTVPAWQLLFSTALGQVLINIWVINPPGTIVKKMEVSDIVAIWIYDVLWLVFLDIVKMTAGGIWEKIKSPDIDSNPALQGGQRKKRMSNNLQGGYVVASAHLGGADSEDVKEKKKRISARLEQGR